MRLRDHRGDRVTDPTGSIVGGDDNTDAHTASVRIGSQQMVNGRRLCLGLVLEPFSAISVSSSPDWNISVMMSQPPTNSPFT